MILATQTEVMCRVHGAVEGVVKLCQAGYDGLDISLSQSFFARLSDPEAEWRGQADAQREAAKSFGVSFVQAHAPFGGQKEKYLSESVPLFPLSFAYAARLGLKTVVVHPIQEAPYAGREEELFRMNIEFYKSLLPLAREYDIVIAVENMWLYHSGSQSIADDVCADPRELARYVDTLKEIDPDRFTVCLDLGHVGVCHREPETAIRILGDRIGALHVHDVNYRQDLHTMPYMGSYNWDLICKALKEVNYQGCFTYEADNFLRMLPPETHDTACRLMVEVGRSLIRKIEA